MAILGAVLSLLSGGVTGLLGSAVQSVFAFLGKKQDIKLKQMEFDQQISLRKIDAELMDKEWANKTAVAKIEADMKVGVEDSKAFGKSVWQEPDAYSARATLTPFDSALLVMLDFFKGLIRPGLTLYLCAITTLIYIEAKALVALHGTLMTAEQAYSVYELIISTILYLTTTVVLWWFGQRNKESRAMFK